MPFSGAYIGHRLHRLVFRREGSAQLVCLPSNLEVSVNQSLASLENRHTASLRAHVRLTPLEKGIPVPFPPCHSTHR